MQTVEEAAGGGVVRKALFFLEEFAGVGLHVAAGGAERVLDVKHLVEEDVFDDEGGDGGAVQAAIQDDLIEGGIEEAQLGAPTAAAPAEARAAQAPAKIAAIEAREHRREIVRPAFGDAGEGASAGAAKLIHAAARGRRQREAAVGFERLARSAPAEDAREKKNGGGFDDGRGRAAQRVGKAHVRDVVAQANGVRQAGVGIKLDDELRRAAVSAQTRVQAVK